MATRVTKKTRPWWLWLVDNENHSPTLAGRDGKPFPTDPNTFDLLRRSRWTSTQDLFRKDLAVKSRLPYVRPSLPEYGVPYNFTGTEVGFGPRFDFESLGLEAKSNPHFHPVGWMVRARIHVGVPGGGTQERIATPPMVKFASIVGNDPEWVRVDFWIQPEIYEQHHVVYTGVPRSTYSRSLLEVDIMAPALIEDTYLNSDTTMKYTPETISQLQVALDSYLQHGVPDPRFT